MFRVPHTRTGNSRLDLSGLSSWPMAYLTIYTDDAEPAETLATGDEGEIRERLAARGVTYARWPLADELADDAPPDAVLGAYAEPIARLSSEQGYVLVDVAALHPSADPDWADDSRRRSPEVPGRAHPRRRRGALLRLRQRHLLPAHRRRGVCGARRARRPAERPEGHDPLVRHGDSAGLHRRPLLPRSGRLGRRVHGRPDRRAHPRLRHDRRRTTSRVGAPRRPERPPLDRIPPRGPQHRVAADTHT